MAGYLNNFVGYFLNFFKKDNRSDASGAAACSTPPRRCSSVIEDRRMQADLAKQKSAWSSTVDQQHFHCPHKELMDPTALAKFLFPKRADGNERGDGFKPPKQCCIYHDAAVGFSKEFPRFVPPSARKLQPPPEHSTYGLKRSVSLESCWPTEDRSRLGSRRMSQMHHSISPTDAFGLPFKPLDLDKECAPFKEMAGFTSRHSESSHASKLFVEDRRPKSSRIPVYRKKCRPAKKVSARPPRQPDAVVPREPECTCYREMLGSPVQNGWRVEGHAIYCPKSVVSHRSYLDTRLENLFRVVSKKKYCGNIIDAASHGRWMKWAGLGVDEDAACFKKCAKGRVALNVSEYKRTLEKICLESNLGYWDLVRKMTDIEIGSGADSNSTNSTIPERKQEVIRRSV